jgi:hypothetical protein
MLLEGSILANLRGAIASAERLRGKPVHDDTLQFWRDLLAHARTEMRSCEPSEAQALEPLMGQLQSRLNAREGAR